LGAGDDELAYSAPPATAAIGDATAVAGVDDDADADVSFSAISDSGRECD
jgi:hypothetical protein